MKPIQQETQILYMANRSELVDTIKSLIEAGNEISMVTPLREFTDPDMNGLVVTDWLIIYKRANG